MNGSKRTLLAVATAGVAVAVAVSAAPGSQSRSLAGGTYRVGVESFYGSALSVGRGLRPDAGSSTPRRGRSTRTCSSARSSARITLPGRRGASSFPTSRSACRPRRTAARPTHSGSSAESGSGRRSTARSLRATSGTRSSGSRGPRTTPCTQAPSTTSRASAPTGAARQRRSPASSLRTRRRSRSS